MVLPLLGGILGSAIAGTGALGGIAAGLSPLVASAIGSGLGSFVQTGDIKEAATTGLVSGLGGAFLGGAAGNIAKGVGGADLANMAKEAGVSASTQAGANLLQNVGQGSLLQGAAGEALKEGALTEAVKGGIGQFGKNIPFMSNLGDYGQYMIQDPSRVAGMVGAAVGPAAMYSPDEEGDGKDGKVKRGRRLEGPMYAGPTNPYADMGEMYYGFPTNYMRYGGIVGMQEGGPVPGQPNEKDVINDAIAAIEGRHPAPEVALGIFLQTYGEDALRELVSSVRRGDMQRNRMEEAGMVYGPETGMDMVPAKNVDNGQDILLESGEYVLPKKTVDQVGKENLDQLRAATA